MKNIDLFDAKKNVCNAMFCREFTLDAEYCRQCKLCRRNRRERTLRWGK